MGVEIEDALVMAVANLRKADTAADSWEGGLPDISTSDLHIEFKEPKPVEPLCDNYPFDQYIHNGSATYSEPSEHTPGRDIPIEIEYRDKSKLLIIEIDRDISSVDSIYHSLADALPAELTVYRNLHAAEDSLWNFFLHAERILDIHVLNNGQEVSYQEVEGVPKEDVIGNFAIENATVGFQYEDQPIAVIYNQGSLQIEAPSEEGREYIIQLFEREVIADG